MSATFNSGYAAYCHERFEQLLEGNYKFFILRTGVGCPDSHSDLDGLALPPDHMFWKRYLPPFGNECSCYLLGASSERMVARIGGKIDKNPPSLPW